MERYINADEAMHELAKVFMPDDYPKIVRAISRTRTADVVLQKKGKWITVFVEYPNKTEVMSECTICGQRFKDRTYFCPNCGAVMRTE